MRKLTKELAQRLLNWYVGSLTLMELAGDNLIAVKAAAWKRGVENGVCLCAFRMFEQSISNCDIVDSYCIVKGTWHQFNKWWCKPVDDCKSVEEALQSMRTRISILEKIIANEFNGG